MSPIKALVCRWKVYTDLALGLGREIAQLQLHNPQQAFYKAEMLEVWLRFALFALVGELARLNAIDADHDAHSDDVQTLRRAAYCLAALSILCAKMKLRAAGQMRVAGVAGRSDAQRALCEAPTGRDAACGIHPALCSADAFPNLSYIDSG